MPVETNPSKITATVLKDFISDDFSTSKWLLFTSDEVAQLINTDLSVAEATNDAYSTVDVTVVLLTGNVLFKFLAVANMLKETRSNVDKEVISRLTDNKDVKVFIFLWFAVVKCNYGISNVLPNHNCLAF